MNTRWEDAPLVFVQRPTCPHCGSGATPQTIRSEDNGDGSTTRKSVCARCGERFKVVIELPEIGNPE